MWRLSRQDLTCHQELLHMWETPFTLVFTCLFPRYFTTVFIDTRLWKTRHPWKRFQNFRQSCVLLTDRIKIHQFQPLVWPSNLLYVMLLGCNWWISIRSINNTQDWRILETFPRVFCFPNSRINENSGEVSGKKTSKYKSKGRWEYSFTWAR